MQSVAGWLGPVKPALIAAGSMPPDGGGFLSNFGKISYPCSGPPPPLKWKGPGFRFRQMEMVDMPITNL